MPDWLIPRTSVQCVEPLYCDTRLGAEFVAGHGECWIMEELLVQASLCRVLQKCRVIEGSILGRFHGSIVLQCCLYIATFSHPIKYVRMFDQTWLVCIYTWKRREI